MLDLKMVVNEDENGCLFEQGMNWIAYVSGIVNGCQGKVEGAFFLQHDMIMEVIQVFYGVGTIINLG